MIKQIVLQCPPVTKYFFVKPLKDVDSFKDLGVTITKDLSWGNHIGIIVNKANKVLGLMRRSVGTANSNLLYGRS